MTQDRTRTEELPAPAAITAARLPALVVLWCPDEPERIGEVLLLSANGAQILGRGAAREEVA